MKIIITSTIVPFTRSGRELVVDWLEQKLSEYGHQVEVVKIPFSSHYQKILPQMLGLRLYTLEDTCNRLICICTPSHLIPHPEKYLWLTNDFCKAYSFQESKQDYYSSDAEMLAINEYIMRADSIALAESKKIFTTSELVSKQLMEFNGVESTPLHLPFVKLDSAEHAEHFDALYLNKQLSEKMRVRSNELTSEPDISWETVIRRLTE